jgi:hypothetical protein
VIAAVLLALSVNAQAAKTLRAEAFELVDKHGHVVARLEPVNEGAEILLLTGGKLGARLTTAPGYPAIELYGSDGKPRVVAQVGGGENADVALFSEEGYRFHLAVSSGSQPTLELLSRDGRASQMLTFARLNGADMPQLLLLNEQGKACFEAEGAPDGSGRATAMSKEGEPRAALGGPAGLSVFGAGGQVLWKTPAPRPELR